MRVHVYPADLSGCGYHRLRWPAQALQADGFDVHVPASDLRCAWVDDPLPRVVDVPDPGCDAAVFQRPMRPELLDAMAALQRRGVAVIVEIDDHFDALHPSNPAWGQPRQVAVLRRACRSADLVTVTTPALAEHYGRHGRVAVLPNCVPAAYLQVHSPRSLTLGYVGSPTTHPGDLEVTGPAVGQTLLEVPAATFLAVGGSQTCRILGVAGSHAPWREITDGYPEMVARLDVGIAPLRDSVFNRAKSWLKPLEYAALGVACVASPTPEYVRAAQEGMCVLASRPREWRRELRRLLADPDERARQVDRGREAAARWTYEGHADRWWIAWRAALHHRLARAT